jgi:hypothetical protein
MFRPGYWLKTWQCIGLRATHRQPLREQPVKSDGRERENERLTRELERVRQELIDRDKKVVELEHRIADAERQIADLERKLALAAAELPDLIQSAVFRWNGGRAAAAGQSAKEGRRKPGGQPGHSGHWRGLAPPSHVDQVIEVHPSKCRHCDSRLSRRLPT